MCAVRTVDDVSGDWCRVCELKLLCCSVRYSEGDAENARHENARHDNGGKDHNAGKVNSAY